MDHVFIVQHAHQQTPTGDDDAKFIGVYGSQGEAEDAVRRTENLEGFCESKDGFSIERHKLGEDQWSSGFFTYSYGWSATPSDFIEEWKEHRPALDVRVDDVQVPKIVSIRGTREALTFVSELISTIAKSEESAIKIGSDGAEGRLLSELSLALEIVRDGPRRSSDYPSILTYESIRGIYDIPTE